MEYQSVVAPLETRAHSTHSCLPLKGRKAENMAPPLSSRDSKSVPTGHVGKMKYLNTQKLLRGENEGWVKVFKYTETPKSAPLRERQVWVKEKAYITEKVSLPVCLRMNKIWVWTAMNLICIKFELLANNRNK